MLGLLLWLSHSPYFFLISLGISAWDWEGSTALSNGDQNDGNSIIYPTRRMRRLGDGCAAWCYEDHEEHEEHVRSRDACEMEDCKICDQCTINTQQQECIRHPLLGLDGSCTDQSGDTWSDDNPSFRLNRNRFYFIAAWIALQVLTGPYIYFTDVKKRPQLPDAAELPSNLRIGPDSKFAFEFCHCFSNPQICLYVLCCDPVTSAEVHATAGTGSFWYVFSWVLFAAVVGHMLAAVAEIETRSNVDIEYYVRGLLLAVMMGRKRQALRGRLGQAENSRKNALIGDFCAWFLCACCAGIQEYRHMEACVQDPASVAPVGAPVQVQAATDGAPATIGVTVVGKPVTQTTAAVAAARTGTPVNDTSLDHNRSIK
eukprot:gnl/MRDRNA2_/MRDRNA2_224059_c0_seq1.p1 gnl/MRDRNA2_/MRDRNA2_224059_c0~~gnl/MRDRNA2_/MRDRNA2_224059_c0_seq1.p1  ORF type:complete len:371 (-),score=53.00 gnl/MRDRNA2_/MRDRNA2_224059_c0_seq1:217-1329(-)